MLRSLYIMLDYHVAAVDGEAGRVRDFLFDDESWIVDYLVVDTGTAAEKREVLVNPFAAGSPDWETKRLPVLLTREQIHTSPPVISDMPISRQRRPGLKSPGSHLRSVREVLGYSLHNSDGEIGSLEDFIIEDTLWGMHHLVVALGQPPQRSVIVSPESIRTFSWPGKAAWMNLTLEELEIRPDFDATSAVNRGKENRLYDFYGRPVYPSQPFASENKPAASQ
jgi:hypothetical protein